MFKEVNRIESVYLATADSAKNILDSNAVTLYVGLSCPTVDSCSLGRRKNNFKGSSQSSNTPVPKKFKKGYCLAVLLALELDGVDLLLSFLRCPRVRSSAGAVDKLMKIWERQTEKQTRGRRMRGANATSVMCDPLKKGSFQRGSK